MKNITISFINKMLKEKQPSEKMRMNDIIKQTGLRLDEKITINNKTYYYSKNKKQYYTTWIA